MIHRHLSRCFLLISTVFAPLAAIAQTPDWNIKDPELAAYFETEVDALAKRTVAELAAVKSPQEWTATRAKLREQLVDMLGLSPMPEKTDLKATVTGKLDQPGFTVEKLHFQSRPGLYVTANLYLPKNLDKPAPAVLYVCGHSPVKSRDGKVSYGNKTAHQHHAAWFAQNGYVCLVTDTLQLGEIEGIHHGTYREKMWWWHSRGYTPEGVETWNNIRALDYLCSRPEVDKERLGVTGRSGGGAYSWFLGAMDDRIKAAVPVAGITDLRDHVIDGAIEGHCDCMYMFNTYRWDFPMVSALMAPRALLLANTDKDTIFPLDGVYRIHHQNELLYDRLGAGKNVGLVILEGGHKDTQEIQIPAFKWFNRHLKKDESNVEVVAGRIFDSEQLKVFEQLPADQINTKIQEQFVPMAAASKVPASKEEWAKMRDGWMAALKDKTFRGWPETSAPVELRQVATSDGQGGVGWAQFAFTSQPHVDLLLTVWTLRGAPAPNQVVIHVLDEQDGLGKMDISQADPVQVFVEPRRVGATDEKKRTQILRRYALIGQTHQGMQVYDVRRAIQAVKKMNDKASIVLRASGQTAGVALYASLFEPGVTRLELTDLPASHMQGPQLLNVLRIMDAPAAVAMAAERGTVVLNTSEAQAWAFPQAVIKALELPADRMQVQAKAK
jgi:dienelactone hydrolase